MTENEDEEPRTVNLSAAGAGTGAGTARVSYVSGFPKVQLRYAKNARDKAGETEVIYGGEDDQIVPDYRKREHQRNVISALVNSLAFLEGQKYWFIYRLDEGKWEFEKRQEMIETGWNGLEDAFVRMVEVCDLEDVSLKDSAPYNHVKLLREFRNDILHFESPTVRAREEEEEYDIVEKLQEYDFQQNPVGVSNTYPFNWLSFDLAERSVRMCFTFWRFFAREINMEDELLKGVPRPG